MILRILIVGSLFSVAVRHDERKLALWVGALTAVLLAVAEVVLGTGLSALAGAAFVANLGICLLAMTLLTSDLGAIVWVLVLAGSSFLLVFDVPLAMLKEAIGG
jgi:hypothetical protein